jgi:hypothetical protein
MNEGSETFRVVWNGDSETDCVEVCRELQLAAIQYEVSQQPVSRSGRMGVIWKFEVMVLDSDYELAKEALGLGEDGNETEEQEFEIEENVASISQETSHQNQQKALSYLRKWRPDDANVEVWSQNTSDTSSIVKLSLTENLIHFRLERADNGTLKYFVLPEDEYRAREILREIKNGDPPK